MGLGSRALGFRVLGSLGFRALGFWGFGVLRLYQAAVQVRVSTKALRYFFADSVLGSYNALQKGGLGN